jgi:hypothetical protein
MSFSSLPGVLVAPPSLTSVDVLDVLSKCNSLLMAKMVSLGTVINRACDKEMEYMVSGKEQKRVVKKAHGEW